MKRERAKIAFCVMLALACSPWGFAGKRAAKQGSSCSGPGAAGKSSGDSPIAVIEGRPVYKSDLVGPAAAQLLQLHRQEYKIESEALDALINRKVVEAEAKKQGLTVEQLYQKEVDSKVPDPSDAEARGYYLAVKSQTTLPFSDVEPQIKRLIKNAEIQQARVKYAESLRAKANVIVNLQPPTVQLGSNDPPRVEGNPKAPVTIVEFGDFECPFCGRVEPTLMDLLKKYNGKVKLAFRDFPLSTIHPYAEGAAEAGRCAQAQGKFWPMHDAMYADQSKLTETDLIKTASSLGMNEKSFAACLKSNEYEGAIQQDLADGQRAGVTGTPAFFINGRFLGGAVPEAQFEHIIDSELAALKSRNRTVASR